LTIYTYWLYIVISISDFACIYLRLNVWLYKDWFYCYKWLTSQHVITLVLNRTNCFVDVIAVDFIVGKSIVLIGIIWLLYIVIYLIALIDIWMSDCADQHQVLSTNVSVCSVSHTKTTCKRSQKQYFLTAKLQRKTFS